MDSEKRSKVDENKINKIDNFIIELVNKLKEGTKAAENEVKRKIELFTESNEFFESD